MLNVFFFPSSENPRWGLPAYAGVLGWWQHQEAHFCHDCPETGRTTSTEWQQQQVSDKWRNIVCISLMGVAHGEQCIVACVGDRPDAEWMGWLNNRIGGQSWNSGRKGVHVFLTESMCVWCCVIYSSSHLPPSSSKPPVAKKPSKTYTYTSQVAISPLDYQTVGEWLDGLKMGQYKTNFESRGISTTNEVLALDDEALKKMNIAVKGHISKIARSIALGNQKLGREPSMRI